MKVDGNMQGMDNLSRTYSLFECINITNNNRPTVYREINKLFALQNDFSYSSRYWTDKETYTHLKMELKV